MQLVIGIVVAIALHDEGAVALLAGAVAFAVAHFVAVRLHPWTACWWCRGNPRRRDSSGRNWRDCRVCSGSGKRKRVFAGDAS